MGRVDNAPAWSDLNLLDQPCDRPAAKRNEAVVDFLGLLGGVNVHWAVFRGSDDGVERFGRYGPERMRSDADITVGQGDDDFARARNDPEKAVGIIEEAPLLGSGRRTAESAIGIE